MVPPVLNVVLKTELVREERGKNVGPSEFFPLVYKVESGLLLFQNVTLVLCESKCCRSLGVHGHDPFTRKQHKKTSLRSAIVWGKYASFSGV